MSKAILFLGMQIVYCYENYNNDEDDKNDDCLYNYSFYRFEFIDIEFLDDCNETNLLYPET